MTKTIKKWLHAITVKNRKDEIRYKTLLYQPRHTLDTMQNIIQPEQRLVP